MKGWVLVTLLGVALAVNEELLLPLAAPGPPSATVNVSATYTDTQCFGVPLSECPPLGVTCRCKRIDAVSVICCHIASSFLLTEGLHCHVENITRIQIYNASLPNLDTLSIVKDLESLSVSGSTIERLSMPNIPTLTCLNFSETALPNLNATAFYKLPSLEFLSLANLSQNLTKLPEVQVNATLDLSGNLGIECSVVLQYLKDHPHLTFVNEDSTFCSSPKAFNWFNSTERFPLAQLQILRNIEDSCTPGCRCRSASVDIVLGKVPRVSVQVDCSGLGLMVLPLELPPNTISLNVSNNNITSLDLLGSDPTYKHIRELDADSNLISSILALEGSRFIDNFLVLSLRDNRIKSLPTYILSNTFDRNYQQRTVNLGLNKFSCNCSVAQVLKPWLLGNKKHIPDFDLIYCDNMPERVVELDANTVCVYERDWTDYIYYIIAGEVGLLLLLVSKVSYDYWVFKTAGYLPWPASKMPKLPCDWVFE